MISRKEKTNHGGLDAWKKEVPSIRDLFARLQLPVYPIGNGKFMSHSPWKRENDRNPSCMIIPDDEHFHDFSTGKTGNAVTLARLITGIPDLPFPDAIRWLKGDAPATHSPTPLGEPRIKPKLLSPANKACREAKIGQYRSAPTPPLRTKRTPGRNKLAYRIFQEAFAGLEIPGLNPHAVVGMIAVALSRGYDKGDILQVLLLAIETWINTPFYIKRRPDVSDAKFLETKWRHPRLRSCTTIDELTEHLRLGRLLRQLKQDLALVPLRVFSTPTSPQTARNEDPQAVEMCVTQLRAMFRESDRIWITTTYAAKGWCRTREFWIDDITQHGVPTGENGSWTKINPMDYWGTGKENVTEWRHALLESDVLSFEEQLALRERLPYEVVSATYSGSSSVHYVVKIGATKGTYEAKMAAALVAFPEFDRQCRDEARWTRLAGGVNKGVLQKLIPQSSTDIVLEETVLSAPPATRSSSPIVQSPRHWSIGSEHTITLSLHGIMRIFVAVDENTHHCLSVDFAFRQRDPRDPAPGDIIDDLISSAAAQYGIPSVVHDQTGLAHTELSIPAKLHNASTDGLSAGLARTLEHLRQHDWGFTLCEHPHEIRNRLALWRGAYNRSLTKFAYTSAAHSSEATRNLAATTTPRIRRRLSPPDWRITDTSFIPSMQFSTDPDDTDLWDLPRW